MLESIILLVMLSFILPTILGLITIVFWIKPKEAPMDASNRINHIRLCWFALTRPEIFVDKFPWLRNDELDNFK